MNKRKFKTLLHGADYNYDQWLDLPEVLDADLVYMKKASCNVMSVGIFSWAALENEDGVFSFDWLDGLFDRMYGAGLSVILATPSGSKPAWISQKYPEVCRMTVDGKRELHGYRHNHCRTSKKYRDLCVRMNTRLAERYGKHPALLMWHVSNEYNGMPCYCPECIAAFHAWLKKKYGTLEKLNKAWWTTFWSHRFTDWAQIYPADKSIHGMMLDWQRFTSDQTLDFFLAESAPLRSISPEIPVTTNFMIPDVGLDYWAFAPHVDVVSWDSYPRWHFHENDINEAARTAFFHDLHRSYRKSSFMLMESSPGATNWQGISKAKKPGMHVLSSIQAVAHGSDTVQYFQWRQSRGGEEKFHDAVISHLGTDDTRIFREVSELGNILRKISPVVGANTQAEVAIVYDYQNGWALDMAQLPRSIEKNYQEQCIAHYKAFWKKGFATDVVDSVSADFSGYKLVVLPMLYMFRNGVPERIREYVRAGGTVVATYLSGLVDDSDLCFTGGTPGELTDVFGMYVETTDTVVENEKQSLTLSGENYQVTHYADVIRTSSAECLASYTDGYLAGMPAVTCNSFGEGRACYIGARTDPKFLDDFYATVCALSDATPCVTWTIPDGVSVEKRITNDREYFFVLNFNPERCMIDIGSSMYENILSEHNVSGSVELEGYGVCILSHKRG